MKRLKLQGKTQVYIDWANVYGWEKTLERGIDPAKILSYLQTYPKIHDMRFYFGEDNHPKSVAFLKDVRALGYTVVSKPVKHILVEEIEGQKVFRRKCDFDMEICIDVHRALKKGTRSFIFFTGDGDFEPLYKLLRVLHKQVIVVYVAGHLGKEIWELKNGTFKTELKNLLET